MSSRRSFLTGLAGVTGASLLDADLNDHDLDELHAELFANGNRASDLNVFDVDGQGFMDLEAGPVFIESGVSCSASVLLYEWDDAVGLGVEAADDDATASTAVSLSIEEAKEVRDRLDATIALVESETDHMERRERTNL